MARLVEALQHLAQSAVQEAAGPRTVLVAQEAAEEATLSSAKDTTQAALAAGRGAVAGRCGTHDVGCARI
jgi:hypothetical protein